MLRNHGGGVAPHHTRLRGNGMLMSIEVAYLEAYYLVGYNDETMHQAHSPHQNPLQTNLPVLCWSSCIFFSIRLRAAAPFSMLVLASSVSYPHAVLALWPEARTDLFVVSRTKSPVKGTRVTR